MADMARMKSYLFALGTISFLIVGCTAKSSSQSSTAESSVSVQEIDLSKDTRGEWIQIRSDNISMAGYDSSTQTMTVMFDNGKSYWYQPVDQSVWTAFYNAQPHPWSQVGYPALVEGGIPYGKIN